jgi:uncharacterized protein (DUF362 family)
VSDISRRELLKLAALGLGAAALSPILAACKSLTPGAEPTSARPTISTAATAAGTQPSPSDLPSPTQMASSTPLASGVRPDLVVARNGEPDALVRRAIEALGGMALFVPPGANVVVKPNICVSYRTYEYAATTNPWVVGTLVKMAFEAGAKSVSVFDNPFSGDAAEGYATSGIAEQVKAAGGQMVVMSGRKFVSTQIPAGKWLRQADIYDDILKADVVINAPIAKDHSLARLTLGMKNLMGVVAAPADMHANLGQAIADLHTRIKPQLTVVDCVRILTKGGPEGGYLEYVKKLDTVVATSDVVAADSYVAGLFGLKPEDLEYVTAGAAMGLGQSDLSKLRIQELSA